MIGSRISELAPASTPLSGTEDIPLRVASENRRVTVAALGWQIRAMPVAQLADGGAGGGDDRGHGAVDWQTNRQDPSEIAFGNHSTISGGSSNTAYGDFASVGGGANNTAMGGASAVSGGSANTAYGEFASVSGGANNEAMGWGSWVSGGVQNAARGIYSAAAGWRSQADGDFSAAVGLAASAELIGKSAYSGAAAFDALAGSAQAAKSVLAGTTTDGTSRRLTADRLSPAAGNTLNQPMLATQHLRLQVVAQQTGGSAGAVRDCASWEVTALVRRGAVPATTEVVGPGASVAPTHVIGAATLWRIGLAADTTNGGVALSVTGEANKMIRWVASVISVETRI